MGGVVEGVGEVEVVEDGVEVREREEDGEEEIVGVGDIKEESD